MLAVVGVSHRSVPLDLREQCAVPVEERERALASLHRRLGSVALLSTCGRTEVYLDVPVDDAEATIAAASDWLAGRAGRDRDRLLAGVEIATDSNATQHLVRVACGLESALEGEDEILGQVRHAWRDAGRATALSPELDAAFRLAVQTGRQARRLGTADAWTSLATAAAARVALAVGGSAAPRVLIAGTGPMGRHAARSLRERFGPALELAMAGRTPARFIAHAAEVDAQPLDLAGIPDALAWADAAIVALRTRGPVIHAAEIAPRETERPLLIVDLSLPRAVATDVDDVAGVSLRAIDDLVANEGRRSRWDAEEREQVEDLVSAAVRDHTLRTQQPDALRTLASLRMHADGIRRAQLARTLRRMPELDAEARWALDALTRSIVNRLLHEPTMRLKSDSNDELAQQTRTLFGLMNDDS